MFYVSIFGYNDVLLDKFSVLSVNKYSAEREIIDRCKKNGTYNMVSKIRVVEVPLLQVLGIGDRNI